MTVASPLAPSESTTGRVVLENVSWETYGRLLAENGNRPIHLTYDHGLLEIEMPSLKHEKLKGFIGDLVSEAARATGRDILPVGSTTWRREASARGLEADQAYYVAHYAAVFDKDEIDLDRDPPPDLAVEVELTTSTVDKLPIYAELGVPEVWRVTELAAEVLRLGDGGRYQPADKSGTFSLISPALLTSYLRHRADLGHAEAVRRFTAEIRRT